MGKDLKGFECYMAEEELSENTISSYMFAMNDFFSKYDEFNKQNVIAWKNGLLEERSPATVNLRLSAAERYSQFSGIEAKVKRVRVQKQVSIENVMSMEEYKQLESGLKRDHSDKWLCYIRLLSMTGARISEALKFTKADLRKGYSEQRTKGKVRRIYFPKALADDALVIFSDLSDNDRLVLNRFRKPMTKKGFDGMLKKLAEKYEIPSEVAHAHSLRHMFAIEFLKRNNNISLLADLLGHSGVNTTMIYLRLSQAEQKEIIDKVVDW